MRVIVADQDEDRLHRLMHQLESLGCQVLAAFQEKQALLDYSENDLDAAFLDGHFCGIPDFELLQELSPTLHHVLCMDSPEHAFQAFESGVADYLLRPVTAERLSRCLLRLTGEARSRNTTRRVRRNPRYPVKVGDGVLFVDVAKTTHFTFEDHSVWAHAGDRFHTYWRSLSEVEAAFPGISFFRIQRHVLIILDTVLGLRALPTGGLKLKLQGGLELEASRGSSPKLKARLGVP